METWNPWVSQYPILAFSVSIIGEVSFSAVAGREFYLLRVMDNWWSHTVCKKLIWTEDHASCMNTNIPVMVLINIIDSSLYNKTSDNGPSEVGT